MYSHRTYIAMNSTFDTEMCDCTYKQLKSRNIQLEKQQTEIKPSVTGKLGMALHASSVPHTFALVECKHLRARTGRRALNLHLVATAALLAGTV